MVVRNDLRGPKQRARGAVRARPRPAGTQHVSQRRPQPWGSANTIMKGTTDDVVDTHSPPGARPLPPGPLNPISQVGFLRARPLALVGREGTNGPASVGRTRLTRPPRTLQPCLCPKTSPHCSTDPGAEAGREVWLRCVPCP